MSNMLPVLRIIKPGIYCAFQDLGRFGYRHLGVPWSGAMDRHSYLYVNQKLGNDISSPVLEIMGHGLTLEVLENVCVFWSGAQTVFEIDRVTFSNLDGPLYLKPGQMITLTKQTQGNWTYFGIKNGFDVNKIMGSASTMNGTHLTTLKKHDIIGHNNSNYDKFSHNWLRPQHLDTNAPLKVHQGLEFGWLKPEYLEKLTNEAFSITKDYSRMGYRLSGPAILVEDYRECITSAVMPGTIQLLPNGQMIVLMRESQTTGGYPRILQLDELSISILAQKRSGASFQLELI